MPHTCINIQLRREKSEPGLHSFLHVCVTDNVSALVSGAWWFVASRGSVLSAAGLSPLCPQPGPRGARY